MAALLYLKTPCPRASNRGLGCSLVGELMFRWARQLESPTFTAQHHEGGKGNDEARDADRGN